MEKTTGTGISVYIGHQGLLARLDEYLRALASVRLATKTSCCPLYKFRIQLGLLTVER